MQRLMDKLRFTSSNQPKFLDSASFGLSYIDPDKLECLGNMVKNNQALDATYAYIHGEAQDLAGFDIPVYIDGDIMQLRQPLDMQDIEMLLPHGKTIRMNSHYSCCSDHFLLIVKGDEESLYDNMHSDGLTCTATHCRQRYRLVEKPKSMARKAEFMRKCGASEDEIRRLGYIV